MRSLEKQHPVRCVMVSNLATDVYRPARDGKPVREGSRSSLERTPVRPQRHQLQDITASSATPKTERKFAEYYVRHGYVVIFQDCRGCHDSEGEFVNIPERGSGLASTLAVGSSSSHGAMAELGRSELSYAAHTQVALCVSEPPGLKAMYVDCGDSRRLPGRHPARWRLRAQAGHLAYNLGLESPAVQADPRRLGRLKAVDLKAWFASMPWKRGHTPISVIPDTRSTCTSNGSTGASTVSGSN